MISLALKALVLAAVIGCTVEYITTILTWFGRNTKTVVITPKETLRLAFVWGLFYFIWNHWS